jgi:hypothetical protein
MPVRFFQVPLKTMPRAGGQAELTPPKPLRDLAFEYVVVQHGGKEAIVRVEAPEAELKALEKEKDLERLTPAQMRKLRDGYAKPVLKRKLVPQPLSDRDEAAADAGAAEAEPQVEVVEQTVQTVRSGFYLIDVPIVAEEAASQ